MIPTEILAMAPGRELDEAVHRHVFGESGHEPAPAFSTDFAVGAMLLTVLPLFVARAEKPKDPAKPYIAGTLAASLDSSTYHTTLTVSGPTMLGVLCRAALLVAVKSPPASLPDPEVAPALSPAGRRATKRANGAKVGTKSPLSEPMAPKATERPAPAIRQPTIFLSARSKLPPLPKRKPFTMPGDPAK